MAIQTIISSPPTRGTVDDFGPDGAAQRVSRVWSTFFQQLFYIAFADAQSGTTANRPTTNLWPGRPYFDVSLGAHGKKIFVNKDASGWVDSSGNVV